MRTAIGAFDTSQAAPTIGDLMRAGLLEEQISVIAHDEEAASPSYKELGIHCHGLHPMELADIGEVMASGPFAPRFEQGRALEVLRKVGLPADIAARYVDDVKHGGALIAASVPDDKLDETLAIMNRHMAARPPRPYPEAAAERKGGMVQEHERVTPQGVVTIPVIEEELQVGKREVGREGVRVRTEVTERPVREEVELHEEKVDVQRHPVDRPLGAAEPGAFKEQSFEVTTRGEEPIVAKTAKVVEEVTVAKEDVAKKEIIEDRLRRQDVVVEPITEETVSRFGQDLRERHTGKAWGAVEPHARTAWEEKRPGTWDRFVASVKDAFERPFERPVEKKAPPR